MSLRYQEISDFVNAKILQSGLEEKIPAGIVLTGGSSILEGVIDLAEEVFKQVRVGVPQHIFGVCRNSQKSRIRSKHRFASVRKRTK